MKKLFVLLCVISIPVFAFARESVDGQSNILEGDDISFSEEKKTFEKGIMAIRGHMKHVTSSVAKRLVKEVDKIVSKEKNSWMKPHILLGQAINESDLRWWLMRGLDCGITQNRVNLYTWNKKKQKKLCKSLSDSSLKSFVYAMKEHNNYRKKYCKRYKDGTLDQLKCVLNTYYQGPSWLRRRNCKLRRDPWMTDKRYRSRVKRCRIKNRYWLRVYCFAEGVRLGRPPLSKSGRILSCRRARSMKWIKKVYSEKRFKKNKKKVACRLKKVYDQS